jgi:hypothetical protein
MIGLDRLHIGSTSKRYKSQAITPYLHALRCTVHYRQKQTVFSLTVSPIMRLYALSNVLLITPLVTAQLNELAKKAGKLYFGTETESWEFNNTEYFSILTDTREFGQLTPGNSMKES